MQAKENTDNQVQSFVFNSLMDSMHAGLYITDIDTDEIIYMNKSLKKQFGLEHPEGLICWQVLQKGMKGRCPFCPVPRLKEAKDKKASIVWEEENTLLGRIYENYDSLIEWMDGRMVHLQHSLDVTEYKQLFREVGVDELTNLLNRHSGKARLGRLLDRMPQAEKPLTVCLYDINGLKYINDMYGNREGDRVLSYVSETVLKRLNPFDFVFRLSGDEFIIVFEGQGLLDAEESVQNILTAVQEGGKALCMPYDVSFCYGLVEVLPGDIYSVSDAISRADDHMYEQKRRLHIQRAEKRLGASQDELRRAIEAFSYDKEHLYDALVDSTEDYIYIGNMKTGTFRYAPSMVEEFGLPGQIIPNAAAVWGSRVHPHDKKAFLEANQEIADGRAEMHNVEYRAKNKRGEWIWLRCRGRLIRDEDGLPDLFAGMITNLGKKNKVDHVTGLYNKYEFEGDIKKAIADYPDMPFGIIELGMDDFKHINDLYDRSFGDEVIRIMSQKIQSILPDNAQVYRLDGDEFGIFVKNSGEDDILHLYQGIYNAFHHQQEFGGKRFYCTLSAGAAIYPKDADSYSDLRKYASYSLEYSKDSGKNRLTIFSKDILCHKERTLELTELLRRSIEHQFNGFSLCYQPQVETTTGRVVGAEALARWQCDKYGAIAPMEFIPLLEQSGLIIPVGKWVFETALKQCKAWHAHCPEFVMSVNLSYLQVLEPDFLEFIKTAIHKVGIDPANVAVELTESYLVKEIGVIRETFEEIQQMGVRVDMDDFGTGYSSLGVLKSTPVNLVKIDKTFVKGIEAHAFDATFIRSIVALCHDVGKKVCLEGVETEGEYAVVKESGLEYIQGYYFGMPMTAQAFEDAFFKEAG